MSMNILFFTKISDRMKSAIIVTTDHVKQEGVNIPIQRFVIEEKLGEKAPIF